MATISNYDPSSSNMNPNWLTSSLELPLKANLDVPNTKSPPHHAPQSDAPNHDAVPCWRHAWPLRFILSSAIILIMAWYLFQEWISSFIVVFHCQKLLTIAYVICPNFVEALLLHKLISWRRQQTKLNQVGLWRNFVRFQTLRSHSLNQWSLSATIWFSNQQTFFL
jgi:hypothetical protein